MGLRSGAEYLASLRDGRILYIDGARVDDVTAHPAAPISIRREPRKRGALRGTIGQDDHGKALSRQGIGRSRGGLTSKTHLVVEGRGLPMAVLVTGGNVNDSTVFETLMARIRVRRPNGGRPRTRPAALLADKGYAARRIRLHLRERGIKPVIPQRRDQRANRLRQGSRGGRPPAFDTTLYRDRNQVERCFNRLKQFRAIATRYDKLASRYQAGILLAPASSSGPANNQTGPSGACACNSASPGAGSSGQPAVLGIGKKERDFRGFQVRNLRLRRRYCPISMARCYVL
ncbi:hypothetical protein GCM10022221_68880 [Actinocorallia aurea]